VHTPRSPFRGGLRLDGFPCEKQLIRITFATVFSNSPGKVSSRRRYNRGLDLIAGVAQSVEQLIRNEKVGCSIHLSGTIDSPETRSSGGFAVIQKAHPRRNSKQFSPMRLFSWLPLQFVL
jgi:hypothetical protein